MITTVKDAYKEKVLATALESVSVAYGIKKDDVISKCRTEDVSHARHAYCALVVLEFNDPIPDAEKSRRVKLSDIGGYISRDHASALYGARVSHSNNMGGQNTDYIPKYWKARKQFVESLELLSKSDRQKRLGEIHVEMTKLEIEKQQLMDIKKKLRK